MSMNQEEFLGLLWRLEEKLIQLDSLRSQIGKCGGQCHGLDGIDDEGLCQTCSEIFAKVVAEEERLGRDMEFDQVLKKLKNACEEDKSGRYQRILEQARHGKICH